MQNVIFVPIVAMKTLKASLLAAAALLSPPAACGETACGSNAADTLSVRVLVAPTSRFVPFYVEHNDSVISCIDLCEERPHGVRFGDIVQCRILHRDSDQRPRVTGVTVVGHDDGRMPQPISADEFYNIDKGLSFVAVTGTVLDVCKDYIEVVGEARNGEQAVREATRLSPDVVVMDLAMPKKDGAAATHEILEKCPRTRVLILTSYGTSDGIAHALEVGAAGAMMKTADDARIIATIRKIAAGETYISPDIQRQLEANPPVPRLSARQTEVLQMVVDGKTSKEIASMLGIRPDSVDAVTRTLFEKMNVSSRTEAVAIAFRKHLLKI